MKKNILVIIDMQNSFIDPKGKLYIENSNFLIDKANQYLSNIHSNFFDCLIYTKDTHFAHNYTLYEESKSFPIHCEYNTWDWDLAVNLDSVKNKIPHIYELHKDSYDMWAKTQEHNKHDLMYKILNHSNKNIAYDNLDEVLKHYKCDDTHIYLFGVASDYCNKYATIGFLNKGYKTTIIKDLTKGIKEDTIKNIENDNFLCYAKNNGLLYII
jgi:nicotinamidase-related amidase